MRRAVVIVALVAPALVLSFFWLRPEADATWRLPLFHFYVVTFATFSAAVVSFLLSAALEPVARPRHVLGAVAFGVMGTLFLIHGLTTPGAIIPVTHPAVSAVGWSAWLTALSGGFVFAAAGINWPEGPSRRFLVRMITVLGLLLALYIGVVLVTPQWLSAVGQSAAPWHRRLFFGVTLLLWLVAAYQLWQTWRTTANRVDGALAFVAAWLAQATVSMHLFPTWNLSWWLYHFLLLVALLFTASVLLREYEQARQFRLMRYYLGASLILTVIMALVASYLFTAFAQRALSTELERTSAALVQTFVRDVTTMVPEEAPAAEMESIYADMLPSLPVDEARIYDLRYAEATLPAQLPGGGIDRSSAFWQTLVAGETAVQIYAPDEPATGYTPSAAVHTVGTYTLLPGGQEGKLLLTLSEAPQLTQKMMEARGAGLAITAVTMGLLFAVLMVVVARADGIIRARGEELALAYQELRRAEAMRDDLTNMIIHDLRTPLTAISASLELLNHLSEQPLGQAEGQIVDRARRAAHRLNSMIGDILAVAKMETGELTPKLEQVVLAELLAERLEVFSVQATVEEKALRVDCPPHLTARLDPALAGRVVENLVNNAFKYTRPGGTIAVAASGSNGVVQVSVRDTGAGIPDEYKEFIFSKFGQIPGEGSESLRKGAGLGLAFCRLVAEAHGGKIWVEDNPGGGSNFVMQVPAG